MPSNSFAAESDCISSRYASCSSFLVSVASVTCLSKAAMPSVNALISSVSVLIVSVSSSMEMSKSLIICSNSFFLSSVLSKVFSQYSFLWSSSCCSFAKTSTKSSINFKTLSKFTFFPCKAIAIRLRPTSSEPFFDFAWRTMSNALLRSWLSLATICTKLGLGSVFLNKSSASSSLRIFIVWCMARSSSVRSFLRSSHSAVLFPQSFCRSAKNFLSSSNAASDSVSSPCMFTMLTCKSPT
mmetsp:Transcript_37983/g.85538  ORF Transcript_37983/g.85538 Transcript_37983/m.85538 type:complete len:240 (+) Transcript_37983:763-1482(+)